MTLATCSSDGQPWSTPVFYALDESYNFYWYSRKDTKHSLLIRENNKVSASIFGTRGEDEGIGVYIQGEASEVPGSELEHAMNVYANKTASSHEEKVQLTTKEDFLEDAPVRMYKLMPEKIFISNVATKWNGKWIDTRSELRLKELT